MERIIIKTISTIDSLNVKELNELDLGLEIQDFVEPNLSDKDVDELILRYREKLTNFSKPIAIHGPFLDLNPSSPDKLIRDISYYRYLYTLRVANEIGAKYVIFHDQINPYLNEPFLRNLNNVQRKDFWLEILEEASWFKGIILLENIFEESPDMLKELIETINIPNIRINLDIGHAKLGKVSIEEWIKSLGKYISYIHVHSNDGQYDLHKSPSNEEIKLLYYLLNKYHINPIISLEYKINNLKDEIKRFTSNNY